MNFRYWWLKQGKDVFGYGVTNHQETQSSLHRKCLQEQGSTSVTIDIIWVWWKMNNDDSPSMQSTEKMNFTSTLEEIFGECLKQQLDHRNMNSEPLYTSHRPEENIMYRDNMQDMHIKKGKHRL